MTVSLRTWLDEQGGPLGVLRVRDRVDPASYEATAILAQLETDEGAPPVLFETVTDRTGAESSFRMLFNVYSRRESVIRALGSEAVEWRELLAELPALTAHTRPYRTVDEGPVHDIVARGVDVDLRLLPWTRHVEGEGGAYFTPIVVSRDPDSTRYNLSWNRAMYLDSRHAGIHISPRQLWGFQRVAEERGEDLPVALVLGHHPGFNLAAASLTVMAIDEYHVAGALLGESLEVVPSVSYGEALLVPAAAEAVIEGRLLARRRAVEGPFGEYMRYLGPQKLSHVLEVDAITHRRDPIVTEIFAGHRDHLNAHLSIHASLLAAAKNAVPQVVDLGWFEGGGPTTAVISLRKTAEGQPLRAALATIAASNLVKQVIVVDDDIDVFDAQHVLWAVSTRVRAGRDVNILKGVQGSLLDPSHPGFGVTEGLVIDATWPLDAPAPPVARVPDEAITAHPLDAYTIVRM
jgi:2,5-furandicarboxylate decarboxylase 1